MAAFLLIITIIATFFMLEDHRNDWAHSLFDNDKMPPTGGVACSY